jgi:hypothetical protein
MQVDGWWCCPGHVLVAVLGHVLNDKLRSCLSGMPTVHMHSRDAVGWISWWVGLLLQLLPFVHAYSLSALPSQTSSLTQGSVHWV